MELQMNAAENNSCLVVINSMTENYPLAAIDCSLASYDMTFLCEKTVFGTFVHWKKMQLRMLQERAVICPPTWKSISVFCVNFLPYKKGLTVSTDVDDNGWEFMKFCTSILLFDHSYIIYVAI